jgi:flagellar biosynthesis anti-sigma factor FlgM
LTHDIDRILRPPVSGLPTTDQGRGATPARPKASAEVTGRDVAITAYAHQLTTLERAVAASPGVDAGKVDALSEALALGRYRPDAARVVDGFLRLEAQLAYAERSR